MNHLPTARFHTSHEAVHSSRHDFLWGGTAKTTSEPGGSDVLDRFEHFCDELRTRPNQTISRSNRTNLDHPGLSLQIISQKCVILERIAVILVLLRLFLVFCHGGSGKKANGQGRNKGCRDCHLAHRRASVRPSDTSPPRRFGSSCIFFRDARLAFAMLLLENMQTPKSVSFFFDFSSPFAYLASTQIEKVAARHGATVLYKPFLLGALFKMIGTPNVPLHAMPEPKARLFRADIFRWAEHWGVPFHFASRFPMNTVKPLRLVLATPENQKPSLIRAIYRAYWVEDRDISNDEVLADILMNEGFSREFVATTNTDEYRHALRNATNEAAALGLCGVPSFLVDNQLFWGQDRLVFVEKALDGWKAPTG